MEAEGLPHESGKEASPKFIRTPQAGALEQARGGAGMRTTREGLMSVFVLRGLVVGLEGGLSPRLLLRME
jgi:hypothetical protein